jgi:peptidoglycan/LPS O-acetylase OafA/YrhL
VATPAGHVHTEYRADIDGLRAVAVLAVIAYHVAPKRVTGGFVGVDIFFVISGYLISSLLIVALKRRAFSYRDFYARRIRRIFPALILVFLFTLVAGWLFLLPDEYWQLGKHVVAASLFTSNLVLWSEAGYFDAASSLKPLLHLWSLGVEEQFYICWPLILALIWRYTKAKAAWVAAGALVSLLICWRLASAEPSAAFYWPIARSWQLLVGALLAVIAAERAPVGEQQTGRLWLNHTCAWVGAALIAEAVFVADSQSLLPWHRAMVPTLGAVLLICAGPQAHVNRYFLSTKAVVFIGLISYPLYLWHWPLLSFLAIVQPPGPTAAYKIAAVVVALLLAIGTYFFVEKPVRTPPYTQLAWLVSGSALCLLAGLVIVTQSGFADARGPWGVRTTPKRFEPALMQTAACTSAYAGLFHPALLTDRDFCVQARLGRADVVVVGDSHANRLFDGLRALDHSRSYLNLGRGSCIPLLGYDGAWADTGENLVCEDTVRSILQRSVGIGANVIILHGFFSRAYGGGLRLEGNEAIGPQARATFRLLSDAGVPTLVVLDVPVLPFEPSTCVARPAIRGMVRVPCSFARRDWDSKIGSINSQLRAAGAGLHNVWFFDPASVLCDDLVCHAERDGELLYSDTHHLSPAGAALVGARMLLVINDKRAGEQALARSAHR